MHFLNPIMLWALAVIPPLGAIMVAIAWKRKRQLDEYFGEEPLVSRYSKPLSKEAYQFKGLWLLLGLAALIAFVLVELRAEEPLLDLRLFKNKVFAYAQGMNFIFNLALFGSQFLLPLFLQSVKRNSPLWASRFKENIQTLGRFLKACWKCRISTTALPKLSAFAGKFAKWRSERPRRFLSTASLG